MKKTTFILPALLSLSLISCRESAPVAIDGTSTLKIIVGQTSQNGTFEKLPNAKVILLSEYGSRVDYTNAEGELTVENLPASVYSAAVRQRLATDNSILLTGNKTNITLLPESTVQDTVFVKSVSSSGIAINELYVGGPITSDHYYKDQYIELYNSSDEIKYLDGMMIARVYGNSQADGFKGPGADEGDDGDIDGAKNIYKFPGNPGEKNYPFYPHTFTVLAFTAQNHKAGHPTSVDLSGAEWEFYNQYSPIDIDNPSSKNLINLNSEFTSDFMVSFTNDVILLSDGKDTNWTDGLDITGVVDAVEYDQTSTSKHTLDSRVDKNSIISPPVYTGKSMQRKEPGVDTNDGSLDWEIINVATPGYQK